MVRKQAAAVAPVVTEVEEAKMERFAHLIVFGDEDNDGGYSINEARAKMFITAAVAKKWWASRTVQDYVRSALDSIRQGTEVKISREVDLALRTLREVQLTPPNTYNKVQIDAAKAILAYHLRARGEAEANVALQVVVNTTVPDANVELQRKRMERRLNPRLPGEEVAEADFSEVE